MSSKSVALTAFLLLNGVVVVTAADVHSSSLNLAKSVLKDAVTPSSNHHRRTAQTPTFLHQHRRFGALRNTESEVSRTAVQQSNNNNNEDASTQACDAAFLQCIPHQKCITCFSTMQTEEIDWANIVPETPCHDVLGYLTNGGHCKDLINDQTEADVFCNTFDSCVVWDEEQPEEEEEDGEGGATKVSIDCDSLETCEWEGMHAAFLGDGQCHDNVPGCYNHKVCGYDKGDCCEDTCKSTDYVECGTDGFACRDPESTKCDPELTTECPMNEAEEKAKKEEDQVQCGADETVYRLNMYDSWGDGWDKSVLTVTPKDDPKKIIFTGGLENGSEGTQQICLSRNPACYSATVGGGIWGNEISWDIKPNNAGARPVAEGGAPDQCEFSVAGEVCLNTCDGKPDTAINDPDYKSYKDLSNCIETKCILLLKACEDDDSCSPCLGEIIPDYCFANDNYNALVNCALCTCSEDKPFFCEEKARPGNEPVPGKEEEPSETGTVKQCSAEQTLHGSSSVIKFNQCSDIDTISAIITNYDENNFGALDAFEACAHAFKNEPAHGGKKALDCMGILFNAKEGTSTEATNAEAPTEAIAALASHLYEDAEDFCECAIASNNDAPMCADFLHFKTLLMETLDACKALDEIDCDAWSDFHEDCKSNLLVMFNSINFEAQEQCEFAKSGCGGAGPFPAFRRLDCGHEISKQAWDFYNLFSRGCLGTETPDAPHPPPVPPPAPTPPVPAPPTPAPPTPGAPAEAAKPRPYYAPPDDDDTDARDAPSYAPESKPKHHFFGTFLIFGVVCGAGYWYHKRRSDTFDFMQYRHRRNYGGGMQPAESEMYSGLTMESGASSFEPPTLPPPPSAMDGQML